MSAKQPETRGNLHDLINFHSIGKIQQTKKAADPFRSAAL